MQGRVWMCLFVFCIMVMPNTVRAQLVFGGAIPNDSKIPLDQKFQNYDVRPQFDIPKVETNYWNTLSTGWLNEPVKKWTAASFSTPVQYGLGPKADVWQPLNVTQIVNHIVPPRSQRNLKKPFSEINVTAIGSSGGRGSSSRKECRFYFDDTNQKIPKNDRKYRVCTDGIFTEIERWPPPRTWLPIQAIEECIKYLDLFPSVYVGKNKETCDAFAMKRFQERFEGKFDPSSNFCSRKFTIPRNVPVELKQIIDQLRSEKCSK